jgi:glyoxylase-like metal-dependent hydrolase (beta-lactamase superfamily II)
LEYLSVTEGVGVLPLRTNIGFVRSGTDCAVIDTGIDEDAGKHILKTAASLGLTIKAVVNTHSHSDHYGGNTFLAQRTGAEVLAPAGESWVLEEPWLEAAYLSQGAVPLPQLMNRFVVGPASKVDRTFTEGAFSAGGVQLEAVPLPGHSFAMTGIGAGGVLFCGDALFGEETVRKHGVLFLHDPDRTRASLLKLETLSYLWFVPSHGHPCPRNELASLVRKNISAIDAFDDAIVSVLDGPMAMSKLASMALVAAGLHLDDTSRITLMQSTARAHISCLARRGRIVVSPGTKGTDLEDDLVCSLS